MINVRNKRCAHIPYMKHPSFSVKGSKTPVHCKQHAEDGMVDVRSIRCLQDSCTKQAAYNVVGSKRPAFCRQNADDS